MWYKPYAIAFLFFLLSLACVQKTEQLPRERQAPPLLAKTEPGSVSFQTEWDRMLDEAKREGVVTFYSVAGATTRADITKAFHLKYGIKVEFVQGRGTELIERMLREQKAGLHIADLLNAGLSSQILVAKPAGLLGNVEEFLKLPEVIDPRNWQGGKLPFIDKDKQVLGFVWGRTGTLLRNINLTRESDVVDAFDFLKPEFKGKIVMFDPTFPGPASTWIGAKATYFWKEEKLREFLQGLVKQEVVITRDHRFLVNGVAQGKYLFGILTRSEEANEFLRIGAPIALIKLKEPATVGVSTGVISVPKRLSHKNAATIFLNWLLGREGQSVWAKSVATPSARLDVSTEGVNPFEIITPGEEAYPETEESVLQRERTMAISREILAPLLR